MSRTKEKLVGSIIGMGIAVLLGALFVVDSIWENEYARTLDVTYLLWQEWLGIVLNKYMIAGLIAFLVLGFFIIMKIMQPTQKAEGIFGAPKWLILAVLGVAIVVVCNLIPEQYAIDGRKINRFEKIYLLTKDCMNGEIIELSADTCIVDKYSGKSGSTSVTSITYYLNVDEMYVIPFPTQRLSAVKELISSESTTTLKVYKYSKMLAKSNFSEKLTDSEH